MAQIASKPVASRPADGAADVTAEASTQVDAPKPKATRKPAASRTIDQGGRDRRRGRCPEAEGDPQAGRIEGRHGGHGDRRRGPEEADDDAEAGNGKCGGDRRRPGRRGDRRRPGEEAARPAQGADRLGRLARWTAPGRAAMPRRSLRSRGWSAAGRRTRSCSVGPGGVGKTTLAMDLAAGLLCVDPDVAARPCRSCRGCRLLEHGDHPDLHRLAPVGPGGQIVIGGPDAKVRGVRDLIGELVAHAARRDGSRRDHRGRRTA